MWDWQNDIYKSKWAVRGCINLLKILKRLQKEITSDNKLIETYQAEHEEFLKSDEHKEWLTEWEKRDTDHNELRNDPDP